jgi:cytosine/uracil/thiamine/allantoin permease
MGGYITAGIGIAICPWKLVEDAGAYVETWLVGYSALLGPIAGVLIADYFFTRKTVLYVEELFKADGGLSSQRGLELGWAVCVRRGRGAQCAWLFACGGSRRCDPRCF